MSLQYGVPCPKPEPRRRGKLRKARQAGKVAKAVRAKVVARDGLCRVATGLPGDLGTLHADFYDPCEGLSQWAHLRGTTRAETRGMAPELRHTTAGSAMMCQKHHDQYDGRRRPRLLIEPLTPQGADGPLAFSRPEK